MIRIHAFQHVAHEDLAHIAAWAAEHGHEVAYTRFQDGADPPALDEWDWLFVLGGPMNIYEHDAYPWLVREKACLRRAVDSGKPVIGLCLGAQLLADVLGAPVTRNAYQEIGWHPVEVLARPAPWFDGFPDTLLPFHWHGDTFAIPEGAVRVAASAGCANQGFSWGPNVLALQFHLEITRDTVETWSRLAERVGLPDSPWVQDGEAMRADPALAAASNRVLERLLDNLARSRR